MKQAGIDKFADQRVDKLSGGQTQRVRFALAIAGECELIVLDEPTTAMDVETRRLFWSNMKAEVAEGRTLLFATHYLEEADQAADRILVINKGRLLADGTPAEIKERAGAKRMSFRLERVDEPFLLGLPGLESLELRHDVVQIQTRDSDATLYAVLDAGYRPTEIEVASLGLEQAFIAITSEDDRAGDASAPVRVTRHAEHDQPDDHGERRQGDERHMSSTSGTLALGQGRDHQAQAEQALPVLHARPARRALPGAGQDGGDRGRRPLQDLLPVRDGLARRVQRGVQQQRDPHLPGAEGRLDQAAAAHAACPPTATWWPRSSRPSR